MRDNRDQGVVSSLIIFVIVIMVILAITGCSTTVPVTAKFPEAPRMGLGECPQLQTVKEGVKLSELTNTVTINYSTYYECAVKADQWNEWYAIQKRIFENVK
jgi:flagellar basal body-associated protein FliL